MLFTWLLPLAADDLQTTKEGYGGLIFMGLFFLGVLAAFIWWLRR